jgi:hypothetical protein
MRPRRSSTSAPRSRRAATPRARARLRSGARGRARQRLRAFQPGAARVRARRGRGRGAAPARGARGAARVRRRTRCARQRARGARRARGRGARAGARARTRAAPRRRLVQLRRAAVAAGALRRLPRRRSGARSSSSRASSRRGICSATCCAACRACGVAGGLGRPGARAGALRPGVDGAAGADARGHAVGAALFERHRAFGARLEAAVPAPASAVCAAPRPGAAPARRLPVLRLQPAPRGLVRAAAVRAPRSCAVEVRSATHRDARRGRDDGQGARRRRRLARRRGARRRCARRAHRARRRRHPRRPHRSSRRAAPGGVRAPAGAGAGELARLPGQHRPDAHRATASPTRAPTRPARRPPAHRDLVRLPHSLWCYRPAHDAPHARRATLREERLRDLRLVQSRAQARQARAGCGRRSCCRAAFAPACGGHARWPCARGAAARLRRRGRWIRRAPDRAAARVVGRVPAPVRRRGRGARLPALRRRHDHVRCAVDGRAGARARRRALGVAQRGEHRGRISGWRTGWRRRPRTTCAALAHGRGHAGLAALRRTLRARLRLAADGRAGFARDMEAAYRTLWRAWCVRRLT